MREANRKRKTPAEVEQLQAKKVKTNGTEKTKKDSKKIEKDKKENVGSIECGLKSLLRNVNENLSKAS